MSNSKIKVLVVDDTAVTRLLLVHLSGGDPRIEVIGVGASTGGPPVLQTLLAGLPKDFSVPLLIVQHIARGFLPGLIEWLNQTSSLNVQIAAHGACPLSGHAYVAPDDFHLGVRADRMVLTREGLKTACGMPGEAILLGAANHVLPADKIAPAILALINSQAARRGIEP